MRGLISAASPCADATDAQSAHDHSSSSSCTGAASASASAAATRAAIRTATRAFARAATSAVSHAIAKGSAVSATSATARDHTAAQGLGRMRSLRAAHGDVQRARGARSGDVPRALST